MGMEITTRHLQQADSCARTEKSGVGREPDSASKERFEKAMGQTSGKGAGKEEGIVSSPAPSPASLMESLFGSCMGGMQNAEGSVRTTSSAASGDVAELVDQLVDRILVSEPGKGNPEVRITLGDGALSGAELTLSRATDGQLFVRLSCVDAGAFQTAVGARDSLQAALERSGENARVEVAQGGAEGGNEGDTRRRSATYEGWGENG